MEPLAQAEEPVRVRVALRFLYQDAEFVSGGSSTEPPGLPPIDQLNH